MEHTSIFETWYKNDSGESKHMAIRTYMRLVKAYLISS